MRLTVLAVVLALASPAFAQEALPEPVTKPAPEPTPKADDDLPAQTPEDTPVDQEAAPPSLPAEFDPTKPDLEGTAPRPGQATGVAVEAERQGDGVRWIPRVLLFIPRWTLWTIAQPIRLGVWTYEHFQLHDRVKGALFNWDGTYGLYPVGTYSTDFGIDIGLRFIHKNLFGEGERLRLKVNFGGRYQQGYGMILQSGERFGKRVSATIDTTYERRPNERFFGIGNANELPEPPMMLIDPSLADSAITSRFRENWFRAVARAEIKLVDDLSLRFAGALALRSFANYAGSDPSDPSDPDDLVTGLGIEERFDTSKLVGYDRGVDNIYTETELIYDSRRPSGKYQPRVVDSTGWYVAGHVGRAFGVNGDPTAFWRYGGEVQRFFDLFRGSRVLTLRLLFDATSGGNGRTDDKISFIDLPRLGGTELLRGYPEGRFRDRAITLATAEYSWDLGNFYGAYLFVDAGRAYSSLDDFDPDSLHVGFGGGIQIHTNASFVMRGQLAFSREGNAFLELAFTPAFGRRERVGRY